jgi:O-antigen/teichoic acid export membrane protein
MLLSVLMETTYKNLYSVVIGKFFSAAEVGFYARADQFRALPSENLAGIIGRVSYPLLSGLQDDKDQLKRAFQKILRSTMLLTFMLMLGLAAVAKPLVVTVIGEQWLPAVEYIQLLCFVGMFYPLHTLNLSLLQVQGRSDLFLRLEVIKKVLAVPTIVIGIVIGIKTMIVAMIVHNIFSYYLNSYWSGRLFGYPLREQVRDILPSFCIAALVSSTVWLLGALIVLPEVLLVLMQCLLGGVLWLGVCEAFEFGDYLNMKRLLFESLSGRFR